MSLPNPFQDQAEVDELKHANAAAGKRDLVAPASKIGSKLDKLIKRAKRQDGMLWSSVIEKLELAHADIRAMIRVYESGPK
jgi:hypothetical protein